MRICILSSTFPPQANGKLCGIGDYTFHLSQHLASLHFEIDIITTTTYIGSEQVDSTLRVLPVIDEWSFPGLKKIKDLWRNNLYDALSWQYQPGIYGGKWSIYNSMLAWLARQNGRLVTTFHTLSNPSPISPTRFNALLIAILSQQIIITNERHRQELFNLYPPAKNKHHLIPVGSNILPSIKSWQTRHATCKRVRQKLGIGPKQTLISNFGLIYPDKNLESLVCAVGKLKFAGYPVKLLLIGQVRPRSAAYLAEIKKLVQEQGIENHVIWVHDCPADKVSDYLFASDIYAVPYKDGLTTRRTSALAGMAHGLPVVSTIGPATSEIFTREKGVILVPPNDDDALVESLIDLVTFPEKRRALGEASRRLSKQFSWESVAKQMACVFNEKVGTP